MKTTILRHRRENLKKCSLRGLEKHPVLSFYTYPLDPLPECESYLLLKVGAPPLSEEDQSYPLLLIDGTWKLAETMRNQIQSPLRERSLPHGYKTAYPRRQQDCPDPSLGLASVEALFLAHLILGLPTEGLLDHYHWKESFLSLNQNLPRSPNSN